MEKVSRRIGCSETLLERLPSAPHPLPATGALSVSAGQQLRQDDLQVLLAKHPPSGWGRRQLLQLLFPCPGCWTCEPDCGTEVASHSLTPLGPRLQSPMWPGLFRFPPFTFPSLRMDLSPGSASQPFPDGDSVFSLGGYWLIDWAFVASAPKAVRKVSRQLFEEGQ